MKALAENTPFCATEDLGKDEHRSRIKHSLQQAEKYSHRNQGKHRAEMALIDRAMSYIRRIEKNTEDFTILDAPCGVGRATIFLAQQGYATTGVDLGAGAIKVAREQVELNSVNATIDKADLLCLPYANHCFDVTLCFRFIHHLPTPLHRQEIIAELCRVTHQYLFISYLSPWSATSMKRKIRKLISGTESVQHCNSLAELEGYFAAQGFILAKDFAQTPFVHSLHLAVFVRKAQ
ncbi:MAG: class I SAM-dependent methyltransferase [Desulfuromonas sp.]|nr:class I SAM-dependent methyltransferase [Desulfuromonas sp.]